MINPAQSYNRVLVVDDDPDIVEFITTVLESSGHEVVRASSGEEALERATEFHPDFIFLDIDIPGPDGWLVCSKLKVVKSAPIIVLITGVTRADLGEFADFVHADAMLRKPFTSDDVLRTLNELSGNRRSTA